MAIARRKVRDNATLEDVRILFRNFAGKETKFNTEGNRNFAVILPEAAAEAMKADGWNVKTLEPREEGDAPTHIIRVKLNYRGRPPRVVVVTSKGKTPLDEGLVEILDWADIVKCDVTIRPYNYDVNGSQGVTAYLQSIYVFIQEDYLDQKYDSIPYTEGAGDQLAIESGEDNIIDVEIVEDDLLEIGM